MAAMDVRTARELLRYNRTVFDRYLRAVTRRTWREAAADRGTGHLSLKNTLVHILNVHEAWLVAVAQRQWEIFDVPDRRPDAVDSVAKLARYHRRVWREVDRFAAGLTDRDLRRRVKAPWMPGRYTLADVILQTTIEQAHHLGEVIGVFWQRNWRPPSMTWIENRPPPRGRG
jgi:uncharacterized damage-inducible protein DinB